MNAQPLGQKCAHARALAAERTHAPQLVAFAIPQARKVSWSLFFFFLISRQGKEKEKEKKTSYIKECPTKQKWGEAGEILNIKTISSRNRYRDSQQMVGVGKRWKWKEGKQN